MTAVISPIVIREGAPCTHVSPEIIVDQWRGHGEELSAPDWSHWPRGRTRELWCERGAIAHKFMRYAIKRHNLSLVSAVSGSAIGIHSHSYLAPHLPQHDHMGHRSCAGYRLREGSLPHRQTTRVSSYIALTCIPLFELDGLSRNRSSSGQQALSLVYLIELMYSVKDSTYDGLYMS